MTDTPPTPVEAESREAWVLVPREPDAAMREAAFGPIMHGGRDGPITADFLRQEAALSVYRRMISAAPEPAWGHQANRGVVEYLRNARDDDGGINLGCAETQDLIDRLVTGNTAAPVAPTGGGGADLRAAREAFLNLIADAERFDEDVDGDTDGEGGTIITVRYFLTTDHGQLRELWDALGFTVGRDETLMDAITREIECFPPIAAPAPSADRLGDWALVPRNPTEAMLTAMDKHTRSVPRANGRGNEHVAMLPDERYAAMLDAAPAQPPRGARVAQAGFPVGSENHAEAMRFLGGVETGEAWVLLRNDRPWKVYLDAQAAHDACREARKADIKWREENIHVADVRVFWNVYAASLASPPPTAGPTLEGLEEAAAPLLAEFAQPQFMITTSGPDGYSLEFHWPKSQPDGAARLDQLHDAIRTLAAWVNGGRHEVA